MQAPDGDAATPGITKAGSQAHRQLCPPSPCWLFLENGPATQSCPSVPWHRMGKPQGTGGQWNEPQLMSHGSCEIRKRMKKLSSYVALTQYGAWQNSKVSERAERWLALLGRSDPGSLGMDPTETQGVCEEAGAPLLGRATQDEGTPLFRPSPHHHPGPSAPSRILWPLCKDRSSRDGLLGA